MCGWLPFLGDFLCPYLGLFFACICVRPRVSHTVWGRIRKRTRRRRRRWGTSVVIWPGLMYMCNVHTSWFHFVDVLDEQYACWSIKNVPDRLVGTFSTCSLLLVVMVEEISWTNITNSNNKRRGWTSKCWNFLRNPVCMFLMLQENLLIFQGKVILWGK